MRRSKTFLFSTAAVIGLATSWTAQAEDQAAVPQIAQAAQTAAAPSPGAKARDAQEESEQIVVTGNAHAEGLKKLDASYSITTISDTQIKQAAPSSTADLLKVVPGMFAESSSGESGPNIELRGFPGNSDAPFVTYLVNGAPIYPAATLSFLDNSSQVRLDDMIERQEVELGGTATIFDTGQPGATVNLIQKNGLDDPDGSLRLTYGSGDLYRADVYYGGKLAEDWYGAIGGYYRTEHGIRDTQYPEADGGSIHANITHTFEGGRITFYANEVKDNDAFFVGIPLAVSGGPGTGQPINFSSLPGFDALTGTLLGNAWRNVTIPNLPGGGSISRDLSDGRGIDIHSFSFNYSQQFGDGWTVSDVGGYNAGHTTCYCAFNYGNYVSGPLGAAVAPISGLVGKTLPGMPKGVTVAGFNASLLNNGVSLNPDQQITSAQVWSVDKDVTSFTNEFKLGKEIFPGNTLTAGVYYAHSTDSDFWDLGNNLLLTFQNNAQPINLTVVGSDGKTYNVTRNGFASASFFQINENWTGDNIATYLVDEWKINDQLRLDAGVRREYQSASGTVTNDTTTNLSSDPADLWGIGASVPCASVGGCAGGNNKVIDTSMQAWSWTAGANYYVMPDLAVYARASVGYHLPSFDDLRGNAATPQERAAQYEIGAKTASSWYSASVNAYHIQFWATPTQLIVNNNVEFFTTSTQGYGLDFEGSIRPPEVPGLEVDLTGDYLHAKNDEGPTPATLAANPALAAELAGGGNPFNGAAVPRQPVFQSRLTPSYTVPFDWGQVKLYTTWTHSGPRYADLANSQPLPSYDMLDAGILTYIGDRWDLLFTVTNLNDELALTEGAAQQTGSGVSNGIGIARPEFGRAFQFSATMHF
jgi:outer membrane receptor protein involved in Fe transport